MGVEESQDSSTSQVDSLLPQFCPMGRAGVVWQCSTLDVSPRSGLDNSPMYDGNQGLQFSAKKSFLGF